MIVNFATCCYHIPGNPIVGVIDVGKVILVHMGHIALAFQKKCDIFWIAVSPLVIGKSQRSISKSGLYSDR